MRKQSFIYSYNKGHNFVIIPKLHTQQSIFFKFENNPIPVPIPGNSNTCIGTNATSTPFTQCPTPFPSYAGAHVFAIGQISNSNINFYFQQ